MSELLDCIKRLAGSANQYDLNDAGDMIADAKKRKADEHRTRLLRVEADILVVAYFTTDDMKGALSYLLENVDDVDSEVIIREVRIPDSEVAAHLADRWWPISGVKNAAPTQSKDANAGNNLPPRSGRPD